MINANREAAELTIREHFACEMMKGLITNRECSFVQVVEGGVCVHPEFAAKIALQLADALIAELNKVEEL